MDAHAYLGYPAHAAIELQSEGWVEVMGGAGHRAVVGYSDPSTPADPLSFSADENTPFFASPPLLERVRHVDGLGVALADFRASRRVTAEYVGIYAYRVLEDIATSVSGITDPDNRKQAWAEMHRLFGTTRELWDPVEQASKSSRHGNPLAGEMIRETDAEGILALAKLGLDHWLNYIAEEEGGSGT
jgi:hypothetical protein